MNNNTNNSKLIQEGLIAIEASLKLQSLCLNIIRKVIDPRFLSLEDYMDSLISLDLTFIQANEKLQALKSLIRQFNFEYIKSEEANL